MSKPNLGWLFYKELYRQGNDNTHIKSTLKKITDSFPVDTDKQKLGKFGFTLKTIYPGLIIGSGYTHGVSSDDDIKTGFYFDYTTGLPLISGSSVKGVLRSLFGLSKKERYKVEKEKFIRELIGNKNLDIEILGNEIFEGIDAKTKKTFPMYKRDKFFDAVVVKTQNDGLLREDYITPHKEPLKNPMPIKILKVAGGVSFKFQFDLKDGLLKASEKELLFLKLLQFHGVGAKTNVGYGQFEEWDEEEFEKFKQKHKRDILKTIESEFEKLKVKLEQQLIKNPKPTHDAIKRIENLSGDEKIILKKLADKLISDKSNKWYKKIEKLL